jgi:hypothetical protein
MVSTITGSIDSTASNRRVSHSRRPVYSRTKANQAGGSTVVPMYSAPPQNSCTARPVVKSSSA